MTKKHPLSTYVPFFEDGLSNDIIAQMLQVSSKTVHRNRLKWYESQRIQERVLIEEAKVEVITIASVNSQNMPSLYPHLDENTQMDWLYAQESLAEAMHVNNKVLAEGIKKSVLEEAQRFDLAKNYGKLLKYQLEFFEKVINSYG